MEILKKYVLLLTLFFMPAFAAQRSASSFSRFATAAQRARPIAIKTGIGLAGGAGTYYGTKYALSSPKSSLPSPEYLAKQEQLDKDHDRQQNFDYERAFYSRYYPEVSKIGLLSYVHQWFEEFKKSHPDAGFSPEIILSVRNMNDTTDESNWGSFSEETSYGPKYIINPIGNLRLLNDILKKQSLSIKLSPKEQEILDDAEASLFHEMYHLLDQEHAHGRTKPYEEMTYEEKRYEEFCADEHAMIHGTSQHLNAEQLFFRKHSQRFLNFLLNFPSHPAAYKRAEYFEAAYKEKKALEERLAKETPEENEKNLRKLLERGPRRSWPSADTPPSTARMQ